MGRARRALVRPKGAYDPYHEWVDPNGYRLSDRVWRAGIDVRSNIDAFLDFHIGQGTSAVDMAAFLEDYLTPGARLIRTRRPYGKEGSFAARRLARTEITRAAGAATINASIANPFVTGVQWRLSGSHRDIDICNQYATGGPNGDGIYPPDQVPAYPSHPNEMCSLVPVPTGDVGELINSLRTEIRAASPIADELRGLFNPEFLARTILSGGVDDILGALASM